MAGAIGGSKLLNVKNTYPIGYELISTLDLEDLTKNNPRGRGKWMAKNGRDLTRGYPLDPDFYNRMPHGVFTSTSRTLAATPAVGVCAASPTYFVASAAAGTTAGQYSTDGATWSQTTLVSPASCQVNSAFWNGIRWFFGCSGSAHTCVTSGDNPNSTWTECSSDTTTTLKQAFAYISSLALTIMVPNGAGTSVYSIPDGSTVATARTTTSATHLGICATSNKFFILTATVGIGLQTSTNGTSWTDTTPAGHDTSNALGICSDGNQTIVITYAQYFVVSTDNGATWGKYYPPVEAMLPATDLDTSVLLMNKTEYVNGKFITFIGNVGTGTTKILISGTGKTWFLEHIGNRGTTAQVSVGSMAWKASVYIGVKATTTALSATEDMGQFRMPAMARTGQATSSAFSNFASSQEYIKVAM